MSDNRWSQPAQPPPPMFVGRAERNFVKQINDEVIEKVVGQQVLYFPIDITNSNFHPLYGESLKKSFFVLLTLKATNIVFEVWSLYSTSASANAVFSTVDQNTGLKPWYKLPSNKNFPSSLTI